MSTIESARDRTLSSQQELVRRPKIARVPVEIAGLHFESQAAAARHYGITVQTLRRRIAEGATTEGALQESRTTKPPRALSVRGVSYPSLSAAAAAFAVPVSTIHQRLEFGWTPEQAVGLEAREHKPGNGLPITVEGHRYPSVKQAARRYGLYYRTVHLRLASGWTTEQALGVAPAPRSVLVKGKIYASVAAAARAHGLSAGAVHGRMRQLGLTLEQALAYRPHSRPRRGRSARGVIPAEEPQYLVTTPDGESWRVSDLRTFATNHGIERRVLLALARTHDNSVELNGWRCRHAVPADRWTPAWQL